MHDMRRVTADEFRAFTAGKEFEARRVGSVIHYLESGDWPDNIVASYRPASQERPREGDWQIATDLPLLTGNQEGTSA